MTPDQIIQRADHAKRLLEDRLMVEALDLMEKEIIEQWGACPVRDVEARETLWKFYKTLLKFKGILQGIIESGKVAQFQDKSLKDQVLSLIPKRS